MAPIYIGAFLTPESKATLLERIRPLHPKVFAEHCTIKFKPTPADLQSFEVGRKVKIKVWGYAADDKGQAVMIEGLDTANAHPHITISCAEGVKPVYSNELLERRAGSVATSSLAPTEQFELTAILDCFPRTV